jgi:hypothetical protein
MVHRDIRSVSKHLAFKAFAVGAVRRARKPQR